MTKCLEITPQSQIPYDIYTLDIIRSLYRAKATEKANSVIEEYSKISADNLVYMMGLPPRFKNSYDYQIQVNYHVYTEMARIARENGQTKLADKLEQDFQTRFSNYMQ
jgi:hypothetical protein